MLYIKRKQGQAIVIDNSTRITVVGIEGGVVNVGIEFRPGTNVVRAEVHDKVVAENISAQDNTKDDLGSILPDDS